MLRQRVRCVLMLVVLLAGTVGCAKSSTVHRTERTARTASVEPKQEPSSYDYVETETETTTETERQSEPRGVLSTTVHIIGEILALPFRLIAGLFQLVF